MNANVQRAVLAWVALAAVAILLWEVRAVVAIGLVGITASTALREPVLRLTRRNLSRRAAVTIVGGAMTLATVALAWLVWSQATGLPKLAADALGVYTAVHDAVANVADVGWLAARMPRPVTVTAWLVPSTPEATAALLANAARRSFSLATAAGLAAVIAAYWLVDGDYFARVWLSVLPPGRRTHVLNAWEEAQDRLGAYLRSEFVQGAFVAASAAAAFAALGMPNAVLVAMLTATAWFVPFVGGPMAVLIAGVGGAVISPWTAAWAALLTAAILVFSEVVVERRMLGRTQRASILTVLALICLTRMSGFVGLLAAPIVAHVVDVVQSTIWKALRQTVTAESAVLSERIDALLAKRAALADALAADDGAATDRIVSLTQRLDVLMADVVSFMVQGSGTASEALGSGVGERSGAGHGGEAIRGAGVER